MTFGNQTSATGIGWAKNQFIEVTWRCSRLMAGSADDATTDFAPFQMGSKGWLRGTCLNPAPSSPAFAQSGRRPANPRINFYLALQRLTGGVDHGTSEFMQHHERS